MSTPVAAGTLSASSPAASGVLARRWRGRLAALRESTPATVGIVIVLTWVVLPLLAPLIAHYPPNANHIAALAHNTPHGAHLRGPAPLGRDPLSRSLWAARPALVISPL